MSVNDIDASSSTPACITTRFSPPNSPSTVVKTPSSTASEHTEVDLVWVPSAKVVAFSTVSGTNQPKSFFDLPQSPSSIGERTIARGPLRLYKIQAHNSTFLQCGDVIHPVLKRLRCWQVSSNTFIFPLPTAGTYWRVEIETTDESLLETLEEHLARVCRLLHCENEKEWSEQAPTTENIDPSNEVLQSPLFLRQSLRNRSSRFGSVSKLESSSLKSPIRNAAEVRKLFEPPNPLCKRDSKDSVDIPDTSSKQFPKGTDHGRRLIFEDIRSQASLDDSESHFSFSESEVSSEISSVTSTISESTSASTVLTMSMHDEFRNMNISTEPVLAEESAISQDSAKGPEPDASPTSARFQNTALSQRPVHKSDESEVAENRKLSSNANKHERRPLKALFLVPDSSDWTDLPVDILSVGYDSCSFSRRYKVQYDHCMQAMH
ncbi:inheritance of peroxisomes protein 1-domain-containing protein [Lipomyces oligophaga]|uniref:inheritance of peroxisomes protein 1-domain-containing protein n=1 Tax=Lipomyces oligophaga TaxID=45792 RepID=UPI0034CE0ACB